MPKKIIILICVFAIILIIIVDSQVIYLKRTVEKRGEIEYDVGRFEYHPENLTKYFKNIWKNIKTLFPKDKKG